MAERKSAGSAGQSADPVSLLIQKIDAACLEMRRNLETLGSLKDKKEVHQALQVLEDGVRRLETLYQQDMRAAAADIENFVNELRGSKDKIGELIEFIKKLQHIIAKFEAEPRGRATFIRFVRMEEVDQEMVPLIEVKDAFGRYALVRFLAKRDVGSLAYGQQVIVVGASGAANHVVEVLDRVVKFGVEATVSEILEKDEEGFRALVGSSDHQQKMIVRLRDGISPDSIEAGTRVLVDFTGLMIIEILPQEKDKQYLVDEIPTVTFADIGGLADVKREIQEELAWPLVHPDVDTKLGLPSPKGFVLEGGPGNGKTMLAKAAMNFLCELLKKEHGEEVRGHLISIAGPELLNKWVGETERLLRELFERAKKIASPANPVLMLFDEADSFLRARGRVISSDVHETHVPMFNALMDGLEGSGNIIVILATNRRDLLDPAAIRPGRFDKVFTVPSPDEEAAREILRIYLKPSQIHPKYNVGVYTPTDRNDKPRRDKEGKIVRIKFDCDPERIRAYLIDATVARMYSTEDPRNVFLKIPRPKGDPLIYRYSDFASGARIKNIVDRAKKIARRRYFSDTKNEAVGVMLGDLYTAIEELFKELKAPSARQELLSWLATEGRAKDFFPEEDIVFSTRDDTLGEDAD